jgi:hypothetical protein
MPAFDGRGREPRLGAGSLPSTSVAGPRLIVAMVVIGYEDKAKPYRGS